MYFEYENATVERGYDFILFTIREGNYNGASLANEIQHQITRRYVDVKCIYNTGRGTLTITAPQTFRIFAGSEMADYMFEDWRDADYNPVTVIYQNYMSINEVIRKRMPTHNGVNSFETGFLDLITTHNIYLHCPNLGHYNCIGVKGENSIIKKIPVSSSFGYVIIDSVVAPHDKIDVSKQTINTLSFTLRNVHGDIINLHGAFVSFSLIFQTIE